MVITFWGLVGLKVQGFLSSEVSDSWVMINSWVEMGLGADTD